MPSKLKRAVTLTNTTVTALDAAKEWLQGQVQSDNPLVVTDHKAISIALVALDYYRGIGGKFDLSESTNVMEADFEYEIKEA
jgi:hypothetical protein